MAAQQHASNAVKMSQLHEALQGAEKNMVGPQCVRQACWKRLKTLIRKANICRCSSAHMQAVL